MGLVWSVPEQEKTLSSGSWVERVPADLRQLAEGHRLHCRPAESECEGFGPCHSDLFHAWPLLPHQALTRPFRCTEDEKQRPAASALGPFTHHSTCLRASTCHKALSEQQSRFEFAGASHRPRKPLPGGGPLLSRPAQHEQ